MSVLSEDSRREQDARYRAMTREVGMAFWLTLAAVLLVLWWSGWLSEWLG